jgi:hypothetical protein
MWERAARAIPHGPGRAMPPPLPAPQFPLAWSPFRTSPSPLAWIPKGRGAATAMASAMSGGSCASRARSSGERAAPAAPVNYCPREQLGDIIHQLGDSITKQLGPEAPLPIHPDPNHPALAARSARLLRMAGAAPAKARADDAARASICGGGAAETSRRRMHPHASGMSPFCMCKGVLTDFSTCRKSAKSTCRLIVEVRSSIDARSAG